MYEFSVPKNPSVMRLGHDIKINHMSFTTRHHLYFLPNTYIVSLLHFARRLIKSVCWLKREPERGKEISEDFI